MLCGAIRTQVQGLLLWLSCFQLIHVEFPSHDYDVPADHIVVPEPVLPYDIRTRLGEILGDFFFDRCSPPGP